MTTFSVPAWCCTCTVTASERVMEVEYAYQTSYVPECGCELETGVSSRRWGLSKD